MLVFLASSASADDVDVLLARSRALETESVGLLLEHFRFEGDLGAQRSDSLVVLLEMPHGSPVILKEVVLYLDGKLVARHGYSVDELMQLRAQGTQLLYLTRIPPGLHTLRAEAKVMQGRVNSMAQPFKFSKGKKAKFLSLQFAGAPVREFEVEEW